MEEVPFVQCKVLYVSILVSALNSVFNISSYSTEP